MSGEFTTASLTVPALTPREFDQIRRLASRSRRLS
jgi:hypothetical protein